MAGAKRSSVKRPSVSEAAQRREARKREARRVVEKQAARGRAVKRATEAAERAAQAFESDSAAKASVRAVEASAGAAKTAEVLRTAELAAERAAAVAAEYRTMLASPGTGTSSTYQVGWVDPARPGGPEPDGDGGDADAADELPPVHAALQTGQDLLGELHGLLARLEGRLIPVLSEEVEAPLKAGAIRPSRSSSPVVARVGELNEGLAQAIDRLAALHSGLEV